MNKIALIVNNIYFDTLGRNADTDGIKNYSLILAHYGKNKVIDCLKNSKEYKQKVSKLNDIYNEIFNRNVDDAGIKSYISFIHEKKYKEIKDILYSSEEYRTIISEKKRQLVDLPSIDLIIMETTLCDITDSHIKEYLDNLRNFNTNIYIVTQSTRKRQYKTFYSENPFDVSATSNHVTNSYFIVIDSRYKLHIIAENLKAIFEYQTKNNVIFCIDERIEKYRRYTQFVCPEIGYCFIFHQRNKNILHECIDMKRLCTFPSIDLRLFPYAHIEHSNNSLYVNYEEKRVSKSCYTFTKKLIILFDASTPTPDKDSGSNGIFNIMIGFKELNCDVLFVGFDNVTYFEYYTDKLGTHEIYSHFREKDDYLLPDNLCIDEYIEKAHLLVFCRLNTIQHFKHLFEKYKHKTIFHTLDLHFIRLKRQAIIEGSTVNNTIMHDELYFMKNSKYCTVINKFEVEILKQNNIISNVVEIPINIEIPDFISYEYETRSGALFVGGFNHTPNIDAFNMILDHQLDNICHIHIVGSNLPQSEVSKIKNRRITYHGYLSENALVNLMNLCVLNLVPLRYGAGSKGKLAHALAHNLPSISTDIGIEGMGLDGSIVVQSSIEDFHTNMLALYTNKLKLKELSENGYTFAKSNFSATVNIEIIRKHFM